MSVTSDNGSIGAETVKRAVDECRGNKVRSHNTTDSNMTHEHDHRNRRMQAGDNKDKRGQCGELTWR